VFSIIKNLFKLLQSGHVDKVSYIVVGIGNKGSRYRDTKHNIGFSVIDALLQNCAEIRRGSWCDSEISICRLTSGKIIALAKPRTYVNRSGIALSKLAKRYRLPQSSFLVVVDDYNLPLGVLRFRAKGTHGGHKGLMSIISETGDEFPRLRVGIGPIPDGMDVVSFVLSPFDEEVMEKRNTIVNTATDGVVFFCENGIEAAMNEFNKRE
jgi:PTH1 family peptidyl-tRNA hydrolase